VKKEKNTKNEQNITESSSKSIKDIIKEEEAELKRKRREEKLKKKAGNVYDNQGRIIYDQTRATIPDLNKKHAKGIESRKSGYGRMFITPWCIGMLLFFIIPLINSLIYSFSYVEPSPGELYTEFVGLENYKYIFNEDPNFIDNLTRSLSTLFTSLPIVVIVSLILALVLNGKFAGRTFFRGIFFIPVIVATGVVMTLLSSSYGTYGAIVQLSAEASQDAYSMAGTNSGFNYTELLKSLELPEDLTMEMTKIINNIFNTVWSCGIPVVLYLAGLQTIPAQLYEASKVEGATKWEEFWYITLPMISQTILLVIVFVLIELLTQSQSAVINQAYALMTDNMDYYTSAAMLWIFFAIAGGIIGLIILIYSKTCLKKWN
jgi:ABC-type sugar transport system permease subunit